MIRKAIQILPKVARLLVFIAVVYGVAMAFAVRQAHAEVEEIMLGLGAEMMAYPGGAHSRVRQLRMNGAALQMRTGEVNESLDTVLEYFESQCQARDGRFAEQLAELQERIPEFDVDPASADGTMMMNTGARGYVACLDMGEEREDHNGVIRRVERFLNSGNLSEVGQLRYLYAEKLEDDKTFFMTMFSDADLNLFEMFPSEGDAPGIDPVPRPEGARRVLSSFEENTPYAVTIYAQEGSVREQIRDHYARIMPEQGWMPVELHEGERLTVDDIAIQTFAQGERLINVSIHEEDGQTVATLLSSDDETSL